MKKIKIDVIIPNSGKNKEMLKERKEFLDSFAIAMAEFSAMFHLLHSKIAFSLPTSKHQKEVR